MTKNIEYFNLPCGSLFQSQWAREKRPELKWYYHIGAEIEYVEHGCNQSWISRLIHGKLPKVIPIKKYDDEYRWRYSEDLNLFITKGCVIDISYHGKLKDIPKIFDVFHEIVEQCPSDNVVVFGYELKINDGKIVPESIPWGKPNFMFGHFIQVGFAGY